MVSIEYYSYLLQGQAQRDDTLKSVWPSVSWPWSKPSSSTSQQLLPFFLRWIWFVFVFVRALNIRGYRSSWNRNVFFYHWSFIIMDSFDWKHLLAEGIIMTKVVNVLCATMTSDYLGFFCYQIIQENPSKHTCHANVMCVCVWDS